MNARKEDLASTSYSLTAKLYLNDFIVQCFKQLLEILD